MFRKFESVIKTVLVTAAHCIILHMVVVFRCFYGTVNSIENVCKVREEVDNDLGQFVLSW